ncbi:MAG TPA: hypothetical protein DCY23_05750 [Ruminococcaceae bacterium]|nr:hypothetical protein [Oscillospiraceae bacterium]
MEDISILEELCDMVFEKAQPQTESYKQKRSNAAEAGERLRKTLTDEQKQLLEERDDALGRCASEERLLMFRLTIKLAFALLKEMGETK